MRCILKSGQIKLWIVIGIFCYIHHNMAGVLCAAFFIGLIIFFYIIFAIADKVDSKMNITNPPRFYEQEEDESPFIGYGKLMNDVVDDPLEGSLIINHNDETLEDEYGNKRSDLVEIEETYVKDREGHIYLRNRYK